MKSFTDEHIDAQAKKTSGKTTQKKSALPSTTKVVGDEIYDLYGVVIHVGSSTSSGHYFAYCKNMQNNSWYECNDSHIGGLSSESNALNKEAYLLFYQKRCPETKQVSEVMIETPKKVKKQQAQQLLTTSEKKVETADVIMTTTP